MSEVTDITVLEIKPEQAPALYVANGLDQYLELIRQQVNEVPDLTTAKGRTRVASLAAQVSRSKTLIEKPGRDYLRHLKEAVKPAEAELRRFVTECDNLRDEVRRPLTEWEAEQERIAAEKAAEEERQRIEAEQRAAAEAKAEAERQRIAHEEQIRRQAVEQARIEDEQKAQQEREAAAQREADLKAAKEKAEADAKAAQELAEREAREAKEKAEREKQAAIEAEQLKAKQETDRVKLEAEQREIARQAEEKRIADEAAARAANEVHRKAIGTAIVKALMSNAGLSREQAIATLTALKDDLIPHTTINY